MHLPASYARAGNAERRYPVIYVLDGESLFSTATSIVEFLSGGSNGNFAIPDSIVVGISNTDRLRDFTPTVSLDGPGSRHHPGWKNSGGAGAFIRFLAQELVPEIDREFRTMPYRTIVGHSLGGLLAIEALQAMPKLFNATIAIDASLWWDDAVLVRRAAIARPPIDPHQRIFLAHANLPEVASLPVAIYRDHGDAIRAYAALLDADPALSGRFKFAYFEDEDHGSIPLIALYAGLRFIFAGFKMSGEAAINHPEQIGPHFARISEALGATFLPPEAMVDGAGYYALGDVADVDAAIALFSLNVANYPTSPGAHVGLGKALERKGDIAAAIASYRRALELDAENAHAKDLLTTLTAN